MKELEEDHFEKFPPKENVELFADMQRVYLLDIAKNHTYPNDYLDELELRLKNLQEAVSKGK